MLSGQISPAGSGEASKVGLVEMGDLVLGVRAKGHQQRTVRLRRVRCTIGSGARATLQLRAVGLSDIHCEITREPDGVLVRAVAPNTLLNGAPFVQSELTVGDVLRVGTIDLEVIETGVPPMDALPVGPEMAGVADSGWVHEPAEAVAQTHTELVSAMDTTEASSAAMMPPREETAGKSPRRESQQRRYWQRQLEELDRRQARLEEAQRTFENAIRDLDAKRTVLEQNSADLFAVRQQHEAEYLAEMRKLQQLRHELRESQSQLESRDADFEMKWGRRSEELRLKEQLLAEQEATLTEREQADLRRAEELDHQRRQSQQREDGFEKTRQERTEKLDGRAAELIEREVALSELERSLQSRAEGLAERLSQLNTQEAELQAETTQRAELLDVREAELRNRELQLAQLAAQADELAEQRHQFEQRRKEFETQCEQRIELLDVRELELRDRESTFAERDATVQSQANALTEGRRHLERQETEFQAQCAERADDFDARETELHQREMALAERAADLQAEADRLTEENDRLTGMSARFEEQCAARLQQLEVRQRELDEQSAADEQAAEDLAAQRQRLEARQAELEDQCRQREESFETREQELRRCEQELERREQAITEREDCERSEAEELNEQRDRLSSLQADIEVRRNEQRAREATLVRRESALLEQEAQLSDREIQLARRETEFAERESALAKREVDSQHLTPSDVPIRQETINETAGTIEPDDGSSAQESAEEYLARLGVIRQSASDHRPASESPESPAEPEQSTITDEEHVESEMPVSQAPEDDDRAEADSPVTLDTVLRRMGVTHLIRDEEEDPIETEEVQEEEVEDAADEDIEDTTDEDSARGLGDLSRSPIYADTFAQEEERLAFGQPDEMNAAADHAAEGAGFSSQGEPVDEEAEAINEYMAQLMHRLRGDGGQDVSPRRSPSPIEEKRAAPKPGVSQANVAKAALQPLTSLEARVKAPEQQADLSRMREVANSSTRGAVNQYVYRQTATLRRTKMIFAVLAFATGGMLVWHSFMGGVDWWFAIAGVVGIAMALKWSLDYIRLTNDLEMMAKEDKIPNDQNEELAERQLHQIFRERQLSESAQLGEKAGENQPQRETDQDTDTADEDVPLQLETLLGPAGGTKFSK